MYLGKLGPSTCVLFVLSSTTYFTVHKFIPTLTDPVDISRVPEVYELEQTRSNLGPAIKCTRAPRALERTEVVLEHPTASDYWLHRTGVGGQTESEQALSTSPALPIHFPSAPRP
ncbi:hypothetical protein BDP27DRAFT_1365810 [Rhodocollybia butyracea]|uniref:Uncharacterized protein n=1 Tax=Rhodocollybia butyracea TaxID=206335 RepID=A0A9P5PMV5_9AGAR|nr:hypothetical protein BDP27DRAFT_1365810 [Rhodocollybia butyracea]